MKVITVKQPFATLIAEGLKEYEFRTWKTKYRGDILIHAGKSIDKNAMRRYKHLNLEYPIGCIIAKATITDCIYMDNEMVKFLEEKNPLVYYGVINKTPWDGYGFKLENIEKIEPIFVNGKLSLWDYDYPLKWYIWKRDSMDINEIKRSLEKNKNKILDLWRSLWHRF